MALTESETKTWRLLPYELLPADDQFARSEAMLAHAGAPALRWYQIRPEALILGRSQVTESVDWHACRSGGLYVYRRATGGGAVLAGPDILSLDVVLPAGHPLAVHDVTGSYEWLGRALAEGLQAAAIAAETIPPQQAHAQVASLAGDDPSRLVCYAMFSPHEVLVDGRKVVGLAQARRRMGALLQAGILLSWQPERLLSLLRLSAEERDRAGSALRLRCAGLNTLNDQIDLSELMQLLTHAITSTAAAEIQSAVWTPSERTAIADAQTQFPPLDGNLPIQQP